MTKIEKLDCDEEEAIQELRARMEDSLTPEMKEDTLLFYRFLKARDFDVDKAETMLRKHLVWRKSFQVDTFFEHFKSQEFIMKFLLGSYVGLDKEGCIFRYWPAGNLDVKEVMKCMKMNDYFRHCILFNEADINTLKHLNEKSGRNAYQISFIFDLKDVAFSTLTHKATTEMFLRLTQFNQDNYPERMKSLYVINAPTYFTLIFSVLKRVMSNAMIRKIHVFGQNGWKEALLKAIDADVLPAFLGGNKTDPDGNPLCSSFIFHGGKIPEKYYLTEEERGFKDFSRVQKLTVPQLSKKEVSVEVHESGSIIRWEVQIESKDIGFGLCYKDDEKGFIEILPILKFDTPDGTETYSYKCKKPGTYVFIFDNSYSWINSKEVSYCITVVKPDI